MKAKDGLNNSLINDGYCGSSLFDVPFRFIIASSRHRFQEINLVCNLISPRKDVIADRMTFHN